MKIWKKINKGLLLTIVVLVLLIMYLIGVENQRKADKVDIEIACKNFINITNELVILPEEMQSYTGTLTIENEEKIENTIKEKLKEVMIDNQDALDLQAEYLLGYAISNSNENYIKTKSNKTITKITDYEFDGDQVTVSLETEMEITYKYMNIEEDKEEERKSTQSSSYEEIILQKIDNNWKIVYSDLDYYDYESYTLEIR